jgi:endonuclease YncB( thermonuclease family)
MNWNSAIAVENKPQFLRRCFRDKDLFAMHCADAERGRKMVRDGKRMNFKALRDGVVAVCFLVLMILIAIKVETDAAKTLTGRYHAADGDSLNLSGDRLRLLGIDAPELSQVCKRDGAPWRCGEAARAQLASLVSDGKTVCKGGKEDKYKRLLVTCRDGDLNINREMVRIGLAVAFGDYEAEEEAARGAHRGLWASSFEEPSDWRRRHSAAIETESPHAASFLQQLFGGGL